MKLSGRACALHTDTGEGAVRTGERGKQKRKKNLHLPAMATPESRGKRLTVCLTPDTTHEDCLKKQRGVWVKKPQN